MITWDIATREHNQMRWEKIVEQQLETTVGELNTASIEVQNIAKDTSARHRMLHLFPGKSLG